MLNIGSGFLELTGHLHPILVHLPIGILLTGLLLYWLSSKEKWKTLRSAVPVILLWGAITAVFSCITGYLLSVSDDYDPGLKNWHQWMGLSVAIISIVFYYLVKRTYPSVYLKWISGLLILLIFVTGHLGGSLTHGSDYLSKPLAGIFSNDAGTEVQRKPIANVQKALVYQDLVQPVLESRCYSCHGKNKQKGKLRLDNIASIMKGGEDGKIISPAHADSSLMIQRLLLPREHDDHMPPKEKAQLTKAQIELIHWWITSGADFTKRVEELNQDQQSKAMLASLQEAPKAPAADDEIPADPVDAADQSVVGSLKSKGVVVIPVSQGSHYLTASFVTCRSVGTEEMQLLSKLKKQLIGLNLSFSNISDSLCQSIGQLTALRRLHLGNTNITDKGLAALQHLIQLRHLNLTGTRVTANGLLALNKLEKLQSLYLYQSTVTRNDFAMLEKTLKHVNIDSGNYVVLTLESDTTRLKADNYN